MVERDARGDVVGGEHHRQAGERQHAGPWRAGTHQNAAHAPPAPRAAGVTGAA